MNCPKCQSSEIDSGGFCLVCGLRAVVSEGPAEAGKPGTPQSVLTDVSSAALQVELPEWRLELSRRLQEIKARREGSDMSAAGDDASFVSEPAGMAQANGSEAGTSPPRSAVGRKPRRSPRPPGRQPIRAETVNPDLEQSLQPVEVQDQTKPSDVDTALPAQSPGDIVVRPSLEKVETSRDQYTKELIDSVVARLAVREAKSDNLIEPASEPALTVTPGTGQQVMESAPVSGTGPKPAASQLPIPVSTPEAISTPQPVQAPASEANGRLGRTSLPLPEAGIRAKSESMPTASLGRGTERPALHGTEARQAERKARLPETASHPIPTALPAIAPPPVPEATTPTTGASFETLGEPQDARLILLSRTLAGLVDFITVFLSAGVMMVAVDILEGIDVFDTVSKINYGLLFLVMYFVYSLFFLGMSGQTIGMMLTDLKLAGVSKSRPAFGQILARCCTFLVGTALAGLGLLWGCFDHEARCLHDLLSGTRVVRTLLD